MFRCTWILEEGIEWLKHVIVCLTNIVAYTWFLEEGVEWLKHVNYMYNIVCFRRKKLEKVKCDDTRTKTNFQ